jgi:hypothetical protein
MTEISKREIKRLLMFKPCEITFAYSIITPKLKRAFLAAKKRGVT